MGMVYGNASRDEKCSLIMELEKRFRIGSARCARMEWDTVMYCLQPANGQTGNGLNHIILNAFLR